MNGIAGAPPVQVGFAVSSRTFPRAVDRNRVKRLLREAWRLQKNPLTSRQTAVAGTLHLFFIYQGRELPSYAQLSEKFSVLLEKLTRELAGSGAPGHHEADQ